MRLSAVAFLMILTTFFLSGCTQSKTAGVSDHSSGFYGRDLASRANRTTLASTPAQPVTRSLAPAPIAVTHMPTHSPALVNQSSVIAPSAPISTAWQWPVEGKVIENFGAKRDGIANEGISIAAPEGAQIHAAQGGEVAFVGHKIRDYGNMVILRHPGGALTSYAHTGDIQVAKGDKVKAGQVIALVGHTGSAKTPQLHFALREGDHSVDPLSKFPQHLASN